jgi:twinkle protein
VFSDGHSFCFAGHGIIEKGNQSFVETDGFTYQFVPWRGLTEDTMKFFDVKSKVRDSDGAPLALGFKWPNGRTQVRSRLEKAFIMQGEKTTETGNLFGMDKFSGGGKALTITEGALDAMAVFQMQGSKYPAVSVSSASSAVSDCKRDYEYIDSFERIYLCFDNDEPGQKASAEVASLFDFNKVYVVKLSLNDPNQYLTDPKGDPAKFIKEWWNAKRYVPEGIISSFSEIDDIIDNDGMKPSIPYPFERLQSMTYGIRSGEIVLLKALEGIGKTEIFRAFEYNILKNTDANVGIIHLEEGKARMIKGLVGYELKQPIHLPDRQIPKDEIKKAYRELVGRDDRVHYYTHFGSDDPNIILSTIRFLVAVCGCKYVFLDHITMVVTGLAGEDERKALDYISTRLAMMVEELDFTLFMISHVNDQGQTRGSRNITKVADLVIDLWRDKVADDEEERNTTLMTVEKNRFAGRSGSAGKLLFDPETYTLGEALELPK